MVGFGRKSAKRRESGHSGLPWPVARSFAQDCAPSSPASAWRPRAWPLPRSRAHPPPNRRPPPNRCLQDAACQQQIDQAARLAGRTQYEQALVLYERAYESSQEPRLLVNIGRCYFRIGRSGKALDSYYRLRRALPQLEPEIRAQLEPFIADAKIALAAEGAVLKAEDEKLARDRKSVV